MSIPRRLIPLFLFALANVSAAEAPPDSVFVGGKVLTVDAGFSLKEAFAVRDGRVVATGTSAVIRALAAPGRTQVHELGGRMALPGLIDSHVHAPAAAMFEHDHEVPDMETIADVLAYIAARARVVPAGQWIQTSQVFITRLKESRYPTRAELDAAAPSHPVSFRTGPYNMLNSLALKKCGFDRNFTVTDGGPGLLEKDAAGEPTGLARGLQRFIRTPGPRAATEAEQQARLKTLLRDYNRSGFTTVADRGASVGSVAQYGRLRAQNALTTRVALSQTFPTVGSLDSILTAIDQIAESPWRGDDPWLRMIGTKIWLDGGMLTGSAYMVKPWGRNENYGIRDDTYRGVLNVPGDRLRAMIRRVAGPGMQFTAHTVGDGASEELLAAYADIDRERPMRDLRPCISHSNFMTPETVAAAARLGVVMDIQPIWLYLDTRTLVAQFGYERLRWFQPLRSILAAGGVAGGGSDHMLKIGDLRAINPYNPVLGMWTTITRRAKWHDGRLHPEEALTRRQAIEFYTRLNAQVIRWEKEIGSLEPGKRADFIIVDRDLLECPEDDLRATRVLETWVDGRRVHGP
ncbi:MAG: amidohydrolase [Opitutaceae bacterium]